MRSFNSRGAPTYFASGCDLAGNSPLRTWQAPELPDYRLRGRDPGVSQGLTAWREHTNAAFTQHPLPSDHFYLHHTRLTLMDIIAQHLGVA